MSKKIAIVGIGNDFRGDDSVGLIAVRKARTLFSKQTRSSEASQYSIKTIESQGEISQILDCFEKHDVVYIIDAVVTPALKQGEIVRLDLNGDCGGNGNHSGMNTSFQMEHLSAGTSTHSFNLKQIIDLAEALNTLPAKLVIYGIAGDDFSTTDQPNPKLAASVDQVISMLKTEVDGLSQGKNQG